MKTFTYRPKTAPKPPEAEIELSSNRAVTLSYDRDAAWKAYCDSDHAPRAVFEPAHRQHRLER